MSPHRSLWVGSCLCALGLAALAAGCEDEGAPGCFAAVDRPLAETPLTMMADVSLHRVGDRFALVGVSPEAVRWAAVTEQGDLSNETTLTLPAHVAGPWAAVVGKSAPVTSWWPWSRPRR